MIQRSLRLAVIAGVMALVVTALAADRSSELTRKPRSLVSRPSRVIENPHRVPTLDPNVRPTAIRSSSRSPSILEGTSRSSLTAVGRAGVASPGILICNNGTLWDLQHLDNGQKQIATLGSGSLVHFTWSMWDVIPESLGRVDRFVNMASYSPSTGLAFGDCGVTISGAGADPVLAFGGFACIDVGIDSAAHISFQQREQSSPPWPEPFSSWVLDQAWPGVNLFTDNLMPGSEDHEAVYPHLAIDRAGSPMPPGDEVYHVVSRSTGAEQGKDGDLLYWRHGGEFGTWEGPAMLDTDELSYNHHVATDPTTENLAVVYIRDDLEPSGLLQVVYVESSLNGADWITIGTLAFPMPLAQLGSPPTAVTDYADADGPQSWLECAGEYDLDGRLHIVWVEQVIANISSDCRIMHWDDATFAARVVTEATAFANAGGDGARDLWLAYPQIAFGDGSTLCTDGPPNPGTGGSTSNRDYVYITYEQYGGRTAAEGDDHSHSESEGGAQQNLEIYLAASNDRGATWSPPVNLTNTKTPGCEGRPGSECASERDPSIALQVNDTIHLFYILDKSAGDAVFGQGDWTFNPVMYYRIPGGTDANLICPEIAPNFAASLSHADPDCEYHATLNPPGSQNEQLKIQNLGNAPLNGSISLSPGTATWLQVPTGAFAVAPGDPADVRTVVMNASDPVITGEGLYQAQIEVTHNDESQPSPRVIPVNFFVFDEFICPEYLVLNTGCLWLEVSNTGRVGNLSGLDGGLGRIIGDSSWSLWDGSLVIGVPPSPDTLVYRNIYGAGNGQPGFRALSSLTVDTSAYGTNTGAATARASMTTIDSTIGIEITYTYPQSPDSCEFILIEYQIHNRTTIDITNLVIGDAVDFDVVPGPDSVRGLQAGSQNTGHLEPTWNLVYLQGTDSLGHVVSADWTATRFTAGITAINCEAIPRAWIAPNDPWLIVRPGSGWHEGYLYQEMVRTGFELFPPDDPDPEEDIHVGIVFAQNVDISPADTVRYTVGLVSSTQGNGDPADLIATTKTAWRYAFGWQDLPASFVVPGDESEQPHSFPYRALGVHEDGVGSGCCGCVVEKVSGAEELTITPGPDACQGTIDFSGACCNEFPIQALFRVTDLCGTYEDLCVVTIETDIECDCLCPFQGDFDTDGFLTAIDLGYLIDILFAGLPDVNDVMCATWRSDLDCDGFATALDLGVLIDHLFAGGPGPCEPCCVF